MDENEALYRMKLLVGILGQAVIDCYLGTRRQQQNAVNFLLSDDYRDVVESLKICGVRFKHIFSLHATWEDIPHLAVQNPERLYLNCRVVNFLEGIEGKTILVEDTRGKLKKVPRKAIKKFAGPKAQLVMVA